MRIATVTDLMNKMAELWPFQFPDAKRLSLWGEQYRATLGSLEGDDLNNAWHACMDGWVKKAAPSPADFLKAHHARSQRAANDARPGASGGSFKDRLEARDTKRTDDRRQIIVSYQRDNVRAYSQAREQGWIGQLETQVQRAANMIAQRNEQRRDGKKIPGWSPEYCEGGSERAETFIPWFSIITVDDVDRIEISRETAKVWVEQAKIPGPAPRRAFPNRVLAEAGNRPMESTAA